MTLPKDSFRVHLLVCLPLSPLFLFTGVPPTMQIGSGGKNTSVAPLTCLLVGLNQAALRQRPHCPQSRLCALDREGLQFSQKALENRNNCPTTSVDLCGSPELESKNLNQADNCRDTSSEVLDDGLGGRVPKKGSEEEEQQGHSERNCQK